MTLTEAHNAFLHTRSPQTAADYLDALMLYEQDDRITDDRFFDGLTEIRDYLRHPFKRGAPNVGTAG